jgi:hypothetical protein
MPNARLLNMGYTHGVRDNGGQGVALDRGWLGLRPTRRVIDHSRGSERKAHIMYLRDN